MRTLLRLSLCSALATSLALAAGAASAKEIWNFAMFGGKRAVTSGIEKIADMVKKDTNDQFEINIAYGEALSPAKQIPENMKNGAFEAGQICVGYYPNKFPLLSVMELPFLVPSHDLRVRAKVEAEVLANPDIVAEMKDRWNMRYLAPSFLPAYEFMGNKRITSTADMKGVKMRISGLNATVLEDFGAVATMVTAPEGYEALRRGTIDSFGFPYTYAFGAYKLYEVSKYVTEGVGMGGFMCFQGVTTDAWNRAPQIVRDKMPQYRQAATETMINAYEQQDVKWKKVFREKLEVDPFPASERDKLVAHASEVWAKWAKDQDDKGRPGTKMLEFVKSVVAKYK